MTEKQSLEGITEAYTIKRDIYGDYAIFKHDTICIVSGIEDKQLAETLCTRFNLLHDEREGFIEFIQHQNENINFLEKKCEQLKKENQKLTQKKNDLKDLLVNSEPVLEQKKLQKIIYKMVIDLIDEKIKELSDIDEVNLIPRESITVLNELKEELYENPDNNQYRTNNENN